MTSTSEDRTSSMISVHWTEGGSQSTFFRATLRLRMCVRRRWVFERSQRILATELPTVPKPTRATLQFCARTSLSPAVALLPMTSRLERPVIVPLSPKRNGGCLSLRRTPGRPALYGPQQSVPPAKPKPDCDLEQPPKNCGGGGGGGGVVDKPQP